MKKTILLAAALSTALLANTEIPNTIIPTKSSNIKITIYNSGIAFVNEEREVNVPKGVQNLVYQGVPKNVISESVIPTFTGMETNLFSQNYIYNLVSLQSMLRYSIDKKVEYVKNNAATMENPEVFTGTLITNNPPMIKDDKTGKIITVKDANQILFSAIPENMITKPSLVWRAEAEKYGDLTIDLKYLTTGISWKSDYVLNLSGKTLDINGWITIDNTSGVEYENAQITCLAGEVNRVNNREASFSSDTIVYKTKGISRHKEVKEEAFAGYHIYKIPYRETIQNQQKKQIIFIEKDEVPYTQYGYAVNNYFKNYGEQKIAFQNIVEFKNDKKSNMGIPLPNGTVRTYQKDKSGETHFVGENTIKNTPVKETIKLNIGTMFDVVGSKKVTKFKSTKFERDVETTYEVRNRGKDEVIVKISENIPAYGRKITVSSSCSDNCKIEKKSAFRREFTIKLAPEEVYSFTTEFNVENN